MRLTYLQHPLWTLSSHPLDEWMNGWMDCREAYVAKRFVHSLANSLLSCLLFSFLLSSFLLLYYLLSFSLISLFRPFLP